MDRKLLNETFDVPRGPQKFRELIVYISKEAEDDPFFGSIKLNKILYYADFGAFRRFGTPLTGVSYQKLKMGPAPRNLLIVRRELEKEGAIRLEERLVGNHVQLRTVALRPAALSLFSEDEIALVDEVISELWEHTGTRVSDLSHDIRWSVMNLSDAMPYELAYLSDEPVTEADNKRTKELAAHYGW